MKEARENRRRENVRRDIRQLGLLMLLAGVVAFFLDPGTPDLKSGAFALAGYVSWGIATLAS